MKKYLLLAAILSILLIPDVNAASATNATANATDNSSVGTINWTNSINAQASDNTYASIALSNTGGVSEISHYLYATNFSFSIPAGATIDGIVVDVDGYSNTAGSATFTLDSGRIIKGGGVTGTAKSGGGWTCGSGACTPADEVTVSWGGASDLWGATLTSTDVNAATFGVALSFKEPIANDSTQGYIDQIRMTIYYTASDTTPPAITIQSPTNTTYTTTSVWFNMTGNEALNWSGYSLDGTANITLTNSTGNWNSQNTSMAQGSHNIRFYANDTVGNMNQSALVYFTVDVTPTLTIQSPTSTTYATASVWFNITGSETLNWSAYSLDGAANVTMVNSSGNWNRQNASMADGSHNVKFYANDSSGNMGNSSTISFSVDTIFPSIGFTSPTGTNATTVARNWTEINQTITEANFDTYKFNWNGTNYSIYDDSLVLHMNFNRNTLIGESNTKSVDISKYGNNGTLTNMNLGIDNGSSGWTSSGKFGNALQFQPINATFGSYVSVPNSATFTTSTITVSAWVYTRGFPTTYSRIAQDGWAGYGSWSLMRNNAANTFSFGVAYNASMQCNRVGNINPIGQWVFYTGTYNGTAVSIYENGAYVANTICSGYTANLVLNGTTATFIGWQCHWKFLQRHNRRSPHIQPFFERSRNRIPVSVRVPEIQLDRVAIL